MNTLGLLGPLLATLLLVSPVRQAQDQPVAATGPQGAIDQPAGTATVSGVLDLAGWAVDSSASSGTGVDRVAIALDDTYIKDARYGAPRDDIAAAFGSRFGPSGWNASLDIESLVAPGSHVLEIRVHSVSTDAWSALVRPLQVVGAPRFGVDIHPLWFGVGKAAQDLDRIRANGLSTARLDLSWDALEPNAKGDFNQSQLAKLDDVLELIAARGLHPIITILRTPAWARSGGSANSPPDRPSDYADVVGMIAARYAAVPGMTYEIWNEPNSPVFWDGPAPRDATQYTAILQLAYTRIKSVAPGATVLGGSIVFNDPDFLEGMYAAGAQGYFDGLSLHPYSRSYAPDDTSVPSRSFTLAITEAERVLAEHGDTTTPIWITEMGWSTAQLPDAARADYYRRAVQLTRADPRIAAFCAFELNQGDDSTGPDTGLILPNGTPTASWQAYRQAVVGQ